MPAKKPDASTEALGATVARLRTERGWQQAHLAEALSEHLGRPIDPTLITRLERGRRNTTSAELAALAAILDVSMNALIDGDDPFYDDGFEDWRMRSHMIAARENLIRAARDYGSTRFAFDSAIGEKVEDASAIAERAEIEGWNQANGEH